MNHEGARSSEISEIAEIEEVREVSSPVSDATLPPKEILDEDKLIENYKLNFNPKRVEVVPVDRVFQK